MRNPTRRNRNIGTAKQGHGQDNRMKIPLHWDGDRWFYERVEKAVAVERSVNSRSLTFLVQPVMAGFVHACTIGDICHLLSLAPPDDLAGVDLILLRQPTRKQQGLRPVWGRLAYYAETGKYSGRAIFLEAQQPGVPFRWRRSLTPEDAAEFDRLRADGHEIEGDRRAFSIKPTLVSIRATQLYRTLPHELGHHVDYMAKVSESARDEADYDRLRELYFSRPQCEREAFAHRYADELSDRLRREGAIPFQRMDDPDAIERAGLDPGWFIPG